MVHNLNSERNVSHRSLKRSEEIIWFLLRKKKKKKKEQMHTKIFKVLSDTLSSILGDFAGSPFKVKLLYLAYLVKILKILKTWHVH